MELVAYELSWDRNEMSYVNPLIAKRAVCSLRVEKFLARMLAEMLYNLNK